MESSCGTKYWDSVMESPYGIKLSNLVMQSSPIITSWNQVGKASYRIKLRIKLWKQVKESGCGKKCWNQVVQTSYGIKF